MSTEFDYIIVGSGAAGSALAYRLSQDPAVSVLVLEDGPGLANPFHRIPKGFFFTLKGQRYTHQYSTLPIAGTETSEVWTRGKVLGGSTTVNGMMYSRGFEPDFDSLAQHSGSQRWGWSSFLETYRGMEDHELGASPYRGSGGRLGISAQGETGELANRIFAAGQEMGWAKVEDLNASDDERIGYTPSTVKHGRRTSAATAFLRPAMKRSNVTVQTRTRAGNIVIRDGRAVGVRARHRGNPVEYRARREVILSAGAVESPLLLERSGIGRPQTLRDVGIEVLVESPNVGERVIEQHFPATVQMRLSKRLGATEDLNSLVKQGVGGVRYLLTRRGPIATAGYDFTFQCKSDPSLARPDLAGSVTPFAIDPTAPSMALADHSGFLVGMYAIRPETTSSVHVSAADPEAAPVIQPRYYETDTDRQAASRVLGLCREFIARSPLADVVVDEDFPTSAVSSDPQSALEFGRNFGATVYHGVGSCAMGTNADDVVDAELRVRGVDGLRVVDGSVLPFQVSGNTAAPVMALGLIAGDMIDND